MGQPADRAVIYIPASADAGRWLGRCLEHCARRGYAVVAVIDQGPWEDVRSMLDAGEAEVVVVSQLVHLPPDRVPRMEEATDYGPGLAGGGRRPRPINRH